MSFTWIGTCWSPTTIEISDIFAINFSEVRIQVRMLIFFLYQFIFRVVFSEASHSLENLQEKKILGFHFNKYSKLYEFTKKRTRELHS